METKRYEIHDSLGYIKSYKSRRRAEQALEDMKILSHRTKSERGFYLWEGIFYIKDNKDKKSVSIFKI